MWATGDVLFVQRLSVQRCRHPVTCVFAGQRMHRRGRTVLVSPSACREWTRATRLYERQVCEREESEQRDESAHENQVTARKAEDAKGFTSDSGT
jgi:hypothetical protein